MQGRIENEIKKENEILKKLENMPNYVSDWYYNLKASKKTASTCKDYINKIYHYLAFYNINVKEVKVSDLTLKNTQKYFISIQKREIKGNIQYTSDSYQQTIWCCLNNFLGYLFETNQIEKNYMKLIDKPKNNDLERINEHRILLTKKDFVKILKSVKEGAGTHKAKAFQERLQKRNYSIFLLLMTTGMRETALAEINVNDVDLFLNTLSIIDKGDKRHYYTLPNEVIYSLEEWLEDRATWNSNSDALFITEKGNRITSSAIAKMVKQYCDDALGYNVSPHKIRSGFCSILYEETGNVEFVRRAVGHSNISTTQRYIVTENSERKQASELISGILKI